MIPKIRKRLPGGDSVGMCRELTKDKGKLCKAKEMFNIMLWEVIIGVYIAVKPIRLKTKNSCILSY